MLLIKSDLKKEGLINLYIINFEMELIQSDCNMYENNVIY